MILPLRKSVNGVEEKEHAYLRFRVKQAAQGKLERTWRPIGRVLTVLIAIALIMAGLIGISAIPKKISLDVPAVDYRTEGKLYKRWFSDPKFTGKIHIDKYPYRKEYETFDVDDLILNTLGGMIGYGIYRIVVYVLANLNGHKHHSSLQSS